MATPIQQQANSDHGNFARDYLARAVPRAQPGESVESVRARLSVGAYDCLELVCVVDGQSRLVGIVPLTGLMAAPGARRVDELMRTHPPAVHADVDQERVASLALHHGLNAMPVIDGTGHLLGVVPAQALLHILRQEHVEDLHRLAGLGRETARAREAMEAPPLRRARDRLPWLVIGLLGSMVATAVVAHFERVLEAQVMLAFFIPGLVYMADAIGTQSEAVAVRGLSLSHAGIGHLLGGELRTGIIIGVTLGLLTVPAIWLIFGDIVLAVAVALALAGAGALATSIGIFLPWLFDRLGVDPAYGSGPLATIIQDVISLLIYFMVVSALVL